MSDIAITQNPALIEQNPPLVRAGDLNDVTEQISSIVGGDVLAKVHNPNPELEA